MRLSNETLHECKVRTCADYANKHAVMYEMFIKVNSGSVSDNKLYSSPDNNKTLSKPLTNI